MNRLKDRYQKELKPVLQKEFNIRNVNAVPKLQKITLNVGVGKAGGDKRIIDGVINTIKRISGQKPVLIKARKSISNFKLRQGVVVGVKVTLRGNRMYDFLDKLINVALPRVRDFQGIKPTSFDEQGTLNIGFKEHLVFPEIQSDEVEHIHGLEVAVTTSAQQRLQGYRLLELLGVPFKKEVIRK
ncbi:MAG: 50S ribosomal protein L5 [Patescibacteria group bacterium]|jgi:large subunit ribosomal protein L5